MIYKKHEYFQDSPDNIIEKENVLYVENGKIEMVEEHSTLSKITTNIKNGEIREDYSLETSRNGEEFLNESYKIYDKNLELIEEFDGKFKHIFVRVTDEKTDMCILEDKIPNVIINGTHEFIYDKSHNLVGSNSISNYRKAYNDNFSDVEIRTIVSYKDIFEKVYINIDGQPYSLGQLLDSTGKSIFRDTYKIVYIEKDNFKTWSFKTKENIEIFSYTMDDKDELVKFHIVFTKKENVENPYSQMSEICIEKVEDDYKYMARDVDVSVESPLEYKINLYNGVVGITPLDLDGKEIKVYSMYEVITTTYESEITSVEDGMITLLFNEIKNGEIVEYSLDTVKKIDNKFDFEYAPVPEYVIGGDYKLIKRKFIKTSTGCSGVDTYNNKYSSCIKITKKGGRIGKKLISDKHSYAINYHKDNFVIIINTDFNDMVDYIETVYTDNMCTVMQYKTECNYNAGEESKIPEEILIKVNKLIKLYE